MTNAGRWLFKIISYGILLLLTHKKHNYTLPLYISDIQCLKYQSMMSNNKAKLILMINILSNKILKELYQCLQYDLQVLDLDRVCTNNRHTLVTI